METKDIANKVINKIKDKSVRPKPRWQFLVSNYALWVAGVVAIVMGGLSISVIVYFIKDNDWEVYSQIDESLLDFVFLTLPYFWLVFLAVFAIAAHFNLKHTRKGYRLRFPILLSVMLLCSFVLGGVFYEFGIGQVIDETFKDKSPLYYRLISHRDMVWNRHLQGLLGGRITELLGEKQFKLMDMEGNLWQVDARRAFIPHKDIIVTDYMVRMVGRIVDDDLFHAKFVVPFNSPINIPIPPRDMRPGGEPEMGPGMMDMDEEMDELEFERIPAEPAY